MVHLAANRRRLTTAITEAMDLIHIGEIGGAYDLLCEARPKRAAGQATQPAHRCLITSMSGTTGRTAVELPYSTLQRHTGGIMAGNLWYVAARPGQGKSAHLTSIAKHAVLDRKPGPLLLPRDE